VLFDVYELQLEHMISSDVLFFALVTVAVVLLVWWDTPPWPALVAAGLLVGYSATVRDIGEPMLAVVVIGMIARRMGWRRIVATAAAGIVPIAAYVIWYHSATGQFALDDGGPFLYSRVQTFAECSQMNPPANLRVLCDPRPPADRPDAEDYIWASNQPLMELTPGDNNSENEFTPKLSSMSSSFGKLAIESQPLAYAKAVAGDILTPFDWNRVGSNGDLSNGLGNVTGTGTLFQFERTEPALPAFVTPSTGGYKATRAFGGASLGLTRVVQPWARFLWLYQHVYVRGPIVAVILLLGLAGVVTSLRRRAWRDGRWGGLGLLPWLIGATLVIVPPMTAGYSYRYLLAAVPFLCLAAGLAFAGWRDAKAAKDR
ncbi:MAG TPA: hypothetical protein VGG75_14570, partial [Trebonia sp.]